MSARLGLLAWPARRRAGRAAIVALVAAALVAVMALSRLGGGSSTPEPTATIALDLAAPSTIDAGDPWTIDVAGAPSDELDVLVVTPSGVRRIVEAPIARAATVTVPGELTRRSGHLVAIVSAGTTTATIGVDVRAGPAVDGAIPLAGPRSMVADGEHWTMVTAIPRDRFGNALADGTEIDVVARRPDGGIERVSTEVDGLLAAVRVTSQTLAGRTAVRIDAGGATGPEVEVLEVPGAPVDVALSAPTTPLRADGRSLAVVRTGVLADRFGNVLLDGTAVVARISGPSGFGTARTVTVDGRAEVIVEAPTQPGWIEVEMVVDGVRSEAVALEFTTDVAELHVATSRPAGDLVRLEVGPVLTGLGGFVADGAGVVASGPAGTSRTTLRDGVATLELKARPGSVVSVDVLGVRTEVAVP